VGRGRGIDALASRLSRWLVPALLLLAAPTANADASFTLSALDGGALPRAFEGWARAAHVPLPDGRVMLGLRGCPGRPDLVGCVRTERPRVIYLRPDVRRKRSVFLHELGHVFDMTVMRARDRRAFERVHARVRRGWWAGPSSTGEWFAEAYSLCARYGSRLPARASATYSYRPTPGRHRRSCRVIRRAAAPRQRPRRPSAPAPPPTITEPPQAPAPVAPQPPPPRPCLLGIFCTS
jgi:hypothetical protein